MVTAYDPTYFFPATGFTVQSNHASSGGTGPANSGVVAGELGWTGLVNGVQQAAVGGASGPLSATYADPSASGAVSIDWEKRYSLGNVPPAQGANQGLYEPLDEPKPVKVKQRTGKTGNGA